MRAGSSIAAVCWVLGAGCAGHHSRVDPSDAASSAGSTGGSGIDASIMIIGAAGAPSPENCGTQACPHQSGTSVCCADVNECGYVGSVSGPCVPSLAGNRVLKVVDQSAPAIGLCPEKPCGQGTNCPDGFPSIGSACSDTGACNYCFPGYLSRSFTCKDGVWADLGVSECYSEVIQR